MNVNLLLIIHFGHMMDLKQCKMVIFHQLIQNMPTKLTYMIKLVNKYLKMH